MNIFPREILVIANENKPMGNFVGNYSHTAASLLFVDKQTNGWTWDEYMVLLFKNI